MVKESEIYDAMKSQLAGVVDLQRHEDRYSRGIPDVSFGVQGINGWIELKRLEKWPSDPTAIVKVSHFTAQQKNWIRKRQKFGGNVWFLLQIGSDYLMFDGAHCDEIGNLSRANMLRIAFSICHDKSDLGRWVHTIITSGKITMDTKDIDKISSLIVGETYSLGIIDDPCK